ncbi:MAG TPA: exo-beta-N-acetylmuramidase NamZ domain-containing protein, partial [Ignavibacteriales bacterium]|nr:exo-beta-N-acetylmuramidase NamZ domain-containing protein [Ignavibacteriales bacterium]
AESGKEFIVLDRPNPLSGNRIEGNIAEDGFNSVVSQFKILKLSFFKVSIPGNTLGCCASVIEAANMMARTRSFFILL